MHALATLWHVTQDSLEEGARCNRCGIQCMTRFMSKSGTANGRPHTNNIAGLGRTAHLSLHHCIEGHYNMSRFDKDWRHRVHIDCQTSLLHKAIQEIQIDVGQHVHGYINIVILQLVHSKQKALSAVNLPKQEDHLRISAAPFAFCMGGPYQEAPLSAHQTMIHVILWEVGLSVPFSDYDSTDAQGMAGVHVFSLRMLFTVSSAAACKHNAGVAAKAKTW